MTLHDGVNSAGSPEQEEILRLRAEVARLQLEKDRASEAGLKPPGRGSGIARRIIAVVLVVLTAILAFAAVPALYLRSEVLDTDRYVATVAPLASDPAIQAEISNKVTTQITEAIDIEGITRDAMTELSKVAPRVAAVITGLAPAIAEQTKSLIHTAVSRFVASPQFQDLWTQVNRVAHQGIVNLATGNTGGTVSIDESGTVTISTKEIIARVKTLLVEQGVDIAARIPEVNAQITLLQSPELARATEAIRLLDRTAPILAWLTVLSAIGAIAVAPRGWRRRTTSRVGLGIAVAMALLALALAIGLDIFLSTIPPATVSPAAAQSLVDTLLVPLRTGVRFVFVVGLLMALAAFLTGHSRPAESVREGLARAGDYVTGKVGAGQPRPWQHWLARFRRILEAAVIGVAVLVLILWQYPTAAVAIWTAVLAGLAILLIELLCRPAVAAAHAGETVPGSPPGGPVAGGPCGGPPEVSNPTLPLPLSRGRPTDSLESGRESRVTYTEVRMIRKGHAHLWEPVSRFCCFRLYQWRCQSRRSRRSSRRSPRSSLRSSRRSPRRLIPWATTMAPPTAAAVLRLRRAASGMSGSFLHSFGRLGFGVGVGLEGGYDGLGRNPAAGHELPAGLADGRTERGSPLVLPDEHRRGVAGRDRLGQVHDVLLREHHGQFGLGHAHLTELALVEVGDLRRLECAVLGLPQEDHVQDPDELTMDQVLQERGELAITEVGPGELHDEPVNRP